MSEEKIIPRLCGGTFLTLLLQRKQINKEIGKPNPNSYYLRDLFKICEDNFYSDFKGNSAATLTSKYKSCETETLGWLNTFPDSNISNFKRRIENEYDSLLEEIQQYVDNYLLFDVENPWLVYALLELIRDDQTISNDFLFYCQADGQVISKEELLNKKEICLPSLLIGVWYYIISEKIPNVDGRDTYLTWTKDAKIKNAPRQFISKIGTEYPKKINIISFKKDTSAVIKIQGENNTEGGFVLLPKMAIDYRRPKSPKATKRPLVQHQEYLKRILEKYNSIKTLLYSEEPKPFYDFYVCNNLRKRTYNSKDKNSYTYSFIEDCNIDKLRASSRYIIISGTGGLGKSMMMRHLLLSTAKREIGTLVPVMVTLKDYDSKENLFDFIVKYAITNGLTSKKEELEELATDGKFVFLLDGYDEISTENKEEFDKNIEKLIDSYPRCSYIISSRPSINFISLARFTVFELCEFRKEEAEELVNKLEFRPDEPQIKERFLVELHKRLYRTHREFVGNPLLLTIMLMTFERFADVPSKMHVFYREAYETLATKHDATKGAFKRKLHTELNAEAFERYLAEFCARTYQHELFEFTNMDIQTYFSMLNEVERNRPKFTYVEFKNDLIDNLCLLYLEGTKYQFTHRSFQEYFCALYFSKQKDRNLYRIGMAFNARHRRANTDKTFDMLFDMIPEKVIEYIFLPYLEDWYNKYVVEGDYWIFLQEMYPSIHYSMGETDGGYYTSPREFLYYYIVKKIGIDDHEVGGADLPHDDHFVLEEFAYINTKWEYGNREEEWELVNIDEIDEQYIDVMGEPEVVGANLEVSVEDVIENPERWAEFLVAMTKERFPIYREFHEVQKYYKWLKRETDLRRKDDSDDMFDMFD